jgi:hypothetical protein
VSEYKIQNTAKEVFFVMVMRLTKSKKVAPETLEEALEQFLLWKKAQQISE